ncbi:MAG: hypothetical protein HY924_09755 [Elusimicrobia bacterium]|nr:hypothetical protein [Elusimicrobiota bacterium]
MVRSAFVIAASFLAAAALSAGEHPREHPMEHPMQARPAPKQAGTERDQEAGTLPAKVRRSFEEAVRKHAAPADGKAFMVPDAVLKKVWELKLVRVHKDKIVSVGKEHYFACADFKSVKEGDRSPVDLDFYATRQPDGSWRIDQVLIHKVDGKARFTYSAGNAIVPVRP